MQLSYFQLLLLKKQTIEYLAADVTAFCIVVLVVLMYIGLYICELIKFE